jgi:hypothetical protein
MSVSQEAGRDDRQLTRYLLGLLPEEEREQVDASSIVDDTIAWRLRAIENDLVDAYARGTLSKDVAWSFESHYLSSPRRRAKARFAARFVRAIDPAVDSAVDPAVDPIVEATIRVTTPWYERFLPRALALPPSKRAAAVAAVAATLILAFSALIVRDLRLGRALDEAQTRRMVLEERERSLQQQLQEQRSTAASAAAERERFREALAARGATSAHKTLPSGTSSGADGGQTHGPASFARTAVAIVLFPQMRSAATEVDGTAASGGAGPTISVPLDARHVALELRLEVSDFSRYAASLKDLASQRIVWRSDRIAATVAGSVDQASVSIAVPAHVLA